MQQIAVKVRREYGVVDKTERWIRLKFKSHTVEKVQWLDVEVITLRGDQES